MISLIARAEGLEYPCKHQEILPHVDVEITFGNSKQGKQVGADNKESLE